MAREIPAPKRKPYIGRAVYELCIETWPRRFFDAAVRFWNDSTGEQWAPDPERNDLQPNDPKLAEVGWWLYQQALRHENSTHKWDSRFPEDANPPYLIKQDGSHDPVSLTSQLLPKIEKRARFLSAYGGRNKLAADVRDKNITAAEAARIADENGWTPYPAQLATKWNLPKQLSLPLNETIGLLILGTPKNVCTTIDPRITDDAIEVAARKLFDAAFNGHVRIRGDRGNGSELLGHVLFSRPNKIQAQLSWGRSQIAFGGKISKDVLVEVTSLRRWINLEIEERKRSARPAEHVMSGVATLITDVASFLKPLYEAIPQTEPLPKETPDWERVKSHFDPQRISRDKIYRPARNKAAAACGRKPNVGRPSAK